MITKFRQWIDSSEYKEWKEKRLNTPLEDVDNDFVLGLLIGEIIWVTLLSKYTEREELFTKEEQDEYNKLSDESCDAYFDAPRHLSDGREIHELTPEERKLAYESTERFNKYIDYSNSLLVKYLPHKLEYKELQFWKPLDINVFCNGINNFLWNTDECCYTIDSSDISIEEDRLIRKYIMRIVFKLNSDFFIKKTK